MARAHRARAALCSWAHSGAARSLHSTANIACVALDGPDKVRPSLATVVLGPDAVAAVNISGGKPWARAMTDHLTGVHEADEELPKVEANC